MVYRLARQTNMLLRDHCDRQYSGCKLHQLFNSILSKIFVTSDGNEEMQFSVVGWKTALAAMAANCMTLEDYMCCIVGSNTTFVLC